MQGVSSSASTLRPIPMSLMPLLLAGHLFTDGDRYEFD